MNSQLIAGAIPVFMVLIAIETFLIRRKGLPYFRFNDALGSLGCGIVQQAVAFVLVGLTLGVYATLSSTHRMWVIPTNWWTLIILFVLVDHQYYWFHRASHRINFIWATHVVHHQSEEYNLTTALRQSAIQTVMSAPFYWPLALLGFEFAPFVLLVSLNTVYQFWIHTRLIDKMGPLEAFLNTPSHHRVHHGIEPQYLDKNYAGVFIIWDKLYGTFEREVVPPTYGTVTPLRSWNVLWANTVEWVRIVKLIRTSRTFGEKLWAPFAPPEWNPALPGRQREPGLFDVKPVSGIPRWMAFDFVVVVLVLTATLAIPDISARLHLFCSLWVILSVVSWAGVLQEKRWRSLTTVGRLLVTGLMLFTLFRTRI